MAERSVDEVVVRPGLAHSARVLIPACVGLLVVGLIFDRDSLGLLTSAVAAFIALWALGVRTKHLFADAEHVGVRYLGTIERSAVRADVRNVKAGGGRTLLLMGDRRRPLLILNVADWTDVQIVGFVERLGVPSSWR